jgi:hypothetical protein
VMMMAKAASKRSSGTARRNLSPRAEPRGAKFNMETFQKLAADLSAGRIPLDRVTLSDDPREDPNAVGGLRAIIRGSGLISWHVQYEIEGSRPYLKLGDAEHMNLKEARELARTVRGLADMGIDVQAGLHERLVRELKEKGMKWRP